MRGLFACMNRHIVIREPDGEQRGPYSVDEVMRLMENGTLHSTDPAWSEEQEEWISLSEAICTNPQASSSMPNVAVSRGLAIGWLCVALGLFTFQMFGLGFIFFVAAFVISIVAMCTKQLNQVNHGIALNTSVFVASELALQLIGS